jgi:hypothetical protein
VGWGWLASQTVVAIFLLIVSLKPMIKNRG